MTANQREWGGGDAPRMILFFPVGIGQGATKELVEDEAAIRIASTTYVSSFFFLLLFLFVLNLRELVHTSGVRSSGSWNELAAWHAGSGLREDAAKFRRERITCEVWFAPLL